MRRRTTLYSFVALLALSCTEPRVVGLAPDGGQDGLLQPPPGGGSGGSGGIVGPACAAETIAAVPAPVDLLLLGTKSWVVSVVNGQEQPEAANARQWEQIQAALVDFVNQPMTSGLNVGLSFVPKHFDPMATEIDPNFCKAGTYNELDAYFTALPGGAEALTDVVRDAKLVKSGSPVELALQGAIAALRTRLGANPGRKGVLVFLTSWRAAPFCYAVPKPARDLYFADIARVAEEAFKGTPSILTYAIGAYLDPPEETVGRHLLGGIAAAGGTGSPFILQPDQNFSQKLLETLADIRGRTIPCEYAVPKPATTALDYNKVSVRFKSSAGELEIPYVAQLARCDSNRGGWYYDNQVPPNTVILCPQSCQRVKADVQNAAVDLRFGCKPAVIE